MSGRILRRAAGMSLAVLGAWALTLVSGTPYTAERADHGLLRLAWRARGEQVRVCRQLSPDELEKVPVHMRQQEVCVRRIVPYRLRAMLDGALVLDELVQAGGAHEDRPLFVFFELPISEGPHRLGITFEHVVGAQPFREAEEDPAHEALETPPLLTLDQSITIGARAVMLVTYDDERKQLRLLASPHSGS